MKAALTLIPAVLLLASCGAETPGQEAAVDHCMMVHSGQGMLAHHKGAVEMSEVALKYAKDEKARDLATRVIAAQKAEIAEMEAWLEARSAP